MSSRRASREVTAREVLGPDAITRVVLQKATGSLLYIVTCPTCGLRAQAGALGVLQDLWPHHTITHRARDAT